MFTMSNLVNVLLERHFMFSTVHSSASQKAVVTFFNKRGRKRFVQLYEKMKISFFAFGSSMEKVTKRTKFARTNTS